MDVLYPRAAGLDIHKKVIVACRILPGSGRQVEREVRTFGTTTAAIEELGDWLTASGVTHVAMEATGVYWQPIYNLLEDRFQLVLANAQHIKQVPGRKTDVKDAEWIADLLRHGLIRGSFVPDRARRELRELTRYRTTLVRERAAVANRLQKTLEGANIKLGAVASDVLGASGRAMLERLVAGETDPVVLADEARQSLRAKRPALEATTSKDSWPRSMPRSPRRLQTDTAPPTAVPAGEQPPQAAPAVLAAGEADAATPEPTDAATPPRSAAEAIRCLDTIPGVGQRVAEVLVAEIGRDMRRFPSAAHLASWAGLCPGNHQSAGKRLSGRTRLGNPTLRATLIEAARAAARTHTYLAAQFHRLAARRGSKRAAVAVAHSILTIAYHLLRDGGQYQDLGATYYDERDRTKLTHRLVQRLRTLGLSVELTPALP